MIQLNILVDDFGRACITDFGLSSIGVGDTLLYLHGLTSVSACSYRWTSPELLEEGARPTPASDIWAFGCVCYEVGFIKHLFGDLSSTRHGQILVGKWPFPECASDAQVMQKLLRGAVPVESVPTTGSDQIDGDMQDLMKRCCAREPGSRPKCQEILRGLEMKGFSAKDRNRGHSQAVYEDLQFQSELRRKEYVRIDFARVEQILNRVCSHRSL